MIVFGFISKNKQQELQTVIFISINKNMDTRNKSTKKNEIVLACWLDLEILAHCITSSEWAMGLLPTGNGKTN